MNIAAPLELMICLTGLFINMAPRWGWSVRRLFRILLALIQRQWTTDPRQNLNEA